MSKNLVPTLNTKYWTTEDYKTTYFNDFVFYGLGQGDCKWYGRWLLEIS